MAAPEAGAVAERGPGAAPADSAFSQDVAEIKRKLVRGEAMEEPALDQCGACRAAQAPLHCSVCRLVYYCDKACQQAAWRAHKRRCQPIAVVGAMLSVQVPPLST